MEDDGACANCGATDYIFDYRTGDVCCAECGCCCDVRLDVACGSYKESKDSLGNPDGSVRVYETAPVGAFVLSVADAKAALRNACSNSPPYRRETYWSERCSQWQMREPEIERDHMEIIRRQWDRMRGRFALNGVNFDGTLARWSRHHILDKEDCRELLWTIDKSIGGKPIFVKRYLVRYFIPSFLCLFRVLLAFATANCRLICSICNPELGMHRGT